MNTREISEKYICYLYAQYICIKFQECIACKAESIGVIYIYRVDLQGVRVVSHGNQVRTARTLNRILTSTPVAIKCPGIDISMAGGISGMVGKHIYNIHITLYIEIYWRGWGKSTSLLHGIGVVATE